MRPLLKGRFPHGVGEMSQCDKGGRPRQGGPTYVGEGIPHHNKLQFIAYFPDAG